MIIKWRAENDEEAETFTFQLISVNDEMKGFKQLRIEDNKKCNP